MHVTDTWRTEIHASPMGSPAVSSCSHLKKKKWGARPQQNGVTMIYVIELSGHKCTFQLSTRSKPKIHLYLRNLS